MNERIKELAQQAGLARRRFMFGKYYEDDMTDEQKKFAELIVLECCKVSDDIEPLELPHKTSKFIKQHFGVE